MQGTEGRELWSWASSGGFRQFLWAVSWVAEVELVKGGWMGRYEMVILTFSGWSFGVKCLLVFGRGVCEIGLWLLQVSMDRCMCHVVANVLHGIGLG